MTPPLPSETASKIGQYLSISSERPREAKLEINLSDYIDAREELTSSSEARQRLNNIKADLAQGLSFSNAETLWEIMLSQATSRLNEFDVSTIRSAPLNQFMKGSFAELAKNTIDAAILNGQKEITLTLNIDDQSDPSNITMTIQDNGCGFPDKLINDFQSAEKRDKYICGKGSSSRYGADGVVIPGILGGAGRGLRDLMAMMDYGDEFSLNRGQLVREKKYMRPEDTKMEFGKRPDGLAGAYILMTTSKEPWEEVAKKELSASELGDVESIMKFDFASFKDRFKSKTSESLSHKENVNDNEQNLKP